MAAILRAARTPKGTEVRTVVKHVTQRLRQHWPNTRIVRRGDSHYGRVEAMEWAENNGAGYINLCRLDRLRSWPKRISAAVPAWRLAPGSLTPMLRGNLLGVICFIPGRNGDGPLSRNGNVCARR